jgi:hypothetical protein
VAALGVAGPRDRVRVLLAAFGVAAPAGLGGLLEQRPRPPP